MKNIAFRLFLLFVATIQTLGLSGQTSFDDLLMKKGEVCAAAAYEQGSWDQYWEGNLLRSNANIGTFSRKIVMPMLAYGITDKINFLASVPYISTEATGGQLRGVSGFQDLSLAIKAELFNQQIGPGKLSALGTVGYAFPVSNYLSDYLPFSIGMKTRELTLRGILQYRLDMGLYARGAVAHLWRGNTKVERDSYYNNGYYYSQWMDVPNALNVHGTLGMWLFNNSLKLEANYVSFKCLSGDDIRIYNTPQPTNKMNFDQVGFFGQYWIKSIKGLGVLAYYNQFVNGRNMGQFQNLGAGITYQFSTI